MINGISDRQSTHLVQEPRSCVQTKARMLCFCMRHLPRPPLCTQKRRRNSKVNWKQKFWRLSVVDQERQYSRSGQAKERGTTPPPSPVLFFTADVVWRRHITLTMLSSPKSISYWCNVREAWQIAGRRGGSWPVIDQRPTERSTLESLHFMNSPSITKYNTRDQTQYWATAHLPLPLTKIDPYLLSVDYCRVRGGVSAQLLRCWHWSYTSILFYFLLICLELV